MFPPVPVKVIMGLVPFKQTAVAFVPIEPEGANEKLFLLFENNGFPANNSSKWGNLKIFSKEPFPIPNLAKGLTFNKISELVLMVSEFLKRKISICRALTIVEKVNNNTNNNNL